jgi:lysophospholipase L1-like esterase
MQRGWADRLADVLTARRTAAGLAPLEYANLAIRGKLLPEIVREQVPAAIPMIATGHTLVSIVGGGNDILRPGSNIEKISGQLARAVTHLTAAGADVLLASGYKAGGALEFTRSKTGQFNANIWTIARTCDAAVLDLWGMRSLFDLRLWHEDRLHLLPDGHRRVMNAALLALSQPLEDDGFDVPLPPRAPAPLAEHVTTDARWVGRYVVPWLGRRLARTSSGDGRRVKYPEPVPWPQP